MLLTPKKTKFRFVHSTKYEGKAKGNKDVVFGDFGLMAEEGCYISNRSIEAARKVASRFLKKQGLMLWIRIFPHLGKTKKPLEVRMGSGKGSVESWVAVVKKGTVMFEVQGLDESTSRVLMRKMSSKLPLNCKMVKKNN